MVQPAPTPPEPTDTPAAVDSYTARYMDGGRALVATRKPMPWWFFALLAVAGSVSLASTLASGRLLPLVTLPILVVVTLLLSHLRLTVTASHVHVQYGMFGPRIPIDQIQSVTVGDYPYIQYGGWGIKRSLVDGSWAYSIPGGTGRGVRITYRTANGTQKAVFVSSDQADTVAGAIRRAQEQRSGGLSGQVRVTEGTPADTAGSDTRDPVSRDGASRTAGEASGRG